MAALEDGVANIPHVPGCQGPRSDDVLSGVRRLPRLWRSHMYFDGRGESTSQLSSATDRTRQTLQQCAHVPQLAVHDDILVT